MNKLSNCSKDLLTPTREESVLFVMEKFPPSPPPERVEVIIKEAEPLPGEPTPMPPPPPPPEPTPPPPKEK